MESSDVVLSPPARHAQSFHHQLLLLWLLVLFSDVFDLSSINCHATLSQRSLINWQFRQCHTTNGVSDIYQSLHLRSACNNRSALTVVEAIMPRSRAVGHLQPTSIVC